MAQSPDVRRAAPRPLLTLVRHLPVLGAAIALGGLLLAPSRLAVACSAALLGLCALLEISGWRRRAAVHPRRLVSAAICGALVAGAALAGLEVASGVSSLETVARR